jgi:hypothetical protein
MWPSSYGSWIYNYLCNQCLSPLILWIRISIRARCTTLCDKVCQWLATVLWFSAGPPVSSTNKSDRRDITEILLKVALNTIKQTYVSSNIYRRMYVKQSIYINKAQKFVRFWTFFISSSGHMLLLTPDLYELARDLPHNGMLLSVCVFHMAGN